MLQTSLVRSLRWKSTSCTSCQACTLPPGKSALSCSLEATMAQIVQAMCIEISAFVTYWFLRWCVFASRLNMTDIERIAPLEEASMPYHLAETQKQVIYFASAKPVLRFGIWPLHSRYLLTCSISESRRRFQACVAPGCRVGLQVHPGLHRWR